MKTIRQLLPLVLMLFALTCSAKGNAIETKTVNVASFDAIEAECVKVYVTIGPATGRVTVSGSREALNALSVKVSKGKLKLSSLDKSNRGENILRNFSRKRAVPEVRVTVPSLSKIDTEMSAAVYVDKAFECAGFNVSCETSSLVNLAGVKASGNVKLECETSSSLKIDKLSAAEVKVEVETSSSLTLGSLRAQSASLSAETASSVKVAAIEAGKVKAESETASSIKVGSGNVKNGSFYAETASNINFRGVTVISGSSDSDTGGTVSVSFGAR